MHEWRCWVLECYRRYSRPLSYSSCLSWGIFSLELKKLMEVEYTALNINSSMMLSLVYTGILSGPRNQTVAPGEIVYFNCHGRGTSIAWYINGSQPDPQSYRDRGFNFTYMLLDHSHEPIREENNTITVVAQPSINNTRIECRVQEQAHGTHDDVEIEATLTIIGVGKYVMLTIINRLCTFLCYYNRSYKCVIHEQNLRHNIMVLFTTYCRSTFSSVLQLITAVCWQQCRSSCPAMECAFYLAGIPYHRLHNQCEQSCQS